VTKPSSNLGVLCTKVRLITLGIGVRDKVREENGYKSTTFHPRIEPIRSSRSTEAGLHAPTGAQKESLAPTPERTVDLTELVEVNE